MKRILPLIAAALLGGCGFAPRYETLESQLHSRDLEGAAETMRGSEKRYGKSARLLYYFDRLWAERLSGQLKASAEFAEKANLLLDEIYTKSLTGEALAFLGNDMSLPYQGENFERVMLHTAALLNYAGQRDFDAALVEAKRADQRLQAYVAAAGEGKVAYGEDALSRYLAAAIYESQGRQERWDALIDYKKCLQAFERYQQTYGTPIPKRLMRDLLRLTKVLGEDEAHKEYLERFGDQPVESLRGKGEVIVLLHEGLAPYKVSEYSSLPVKLSDGTAQYFQMAFPKFVPRPTSYQGATLLGPDGRMEELELFQDVTAIALRDLQDRIAMITVKTIARATAKFQAARAIQQKAKEAGGFAELAAILSTNIYGIVSEQADTRSWRTLPGRIHLARMPLPNGLYNNLTLKIRMGGTEEVREFKEVLVREGKKTFLEWAVY